MLCAPRSLCVLRLSCGRSCAQSTAFAPLLSLETPQLCWQRLLSKILPSLLMLPNPDLARMKEPRSSLSVLRLSCGRLSCTTAHRPRRLLPCYHSKHPSHPSFAGRDSPQKYLRSLLTLSESQLCPHERTRLGWSPLPVRLCAHPRNFFLPAGMRHYIQHCRLHHSLPLGPHPHQVCVAVLFAGEKWRELGNNGQGLLVLHSTSFLAAHPL